MRTHGDRPGLSRRAIIAGWGGAPEKPRLMCMWRRTASLSRGHDGLHMGRACFHVLIPQILTWATQQSSRLSWAVQTYLKYHSNVSLTALSSVSESWLEALALGALHCCEALDDLLMMMVFRFGTGAGSGVASTSL